MRIALDGNEANVKERVGTGQYAYNLLELWCRNPSHTFHIYLRNAPLPDLPKESVNWRYHIIGPQKAWTRLALPLALGLSHKHDVFWNPAHYLPPFTFSKSVVTIHDLAYEHFPEYFLPTDLYKLRNWTKASVKKADKIIAVSQATKNDLIQLYLVPSHKIRVIYNGYDEQRFHAKFKIKKQNYILFVGTIQPRKNISNLVHAFSLLKDRGYSGKLVIAGRVGWLADEILTTIKKNRYQQDIILKGYVSEEQRCALTRAAQILVLPSLYEGFGLPLLEAMASGVPVAGSNNSSIPEVIGRGGELFDPTKPEDIAQKIMKVVSSSSTYTQHALRQARKFSWEKCATETLNYITEVQ